jgi:hypothetical protein
LVLDPKGISCKCSEYLPQKDNPAMITITCQCGETYHAEEQHIGGNIRG